MDDRLSQILILFCCREDALVRGSRTPHPEEIPSEKSRKPRASRAGRPLAMASESMCVTPRAGPRHKTT